MRIFFIFQGKFPLRENRSRMDFLFIHNTAKLIFQRKNTLYKQQKNTTLTEKFLKQTEFSNTMTLIKVNKAKHFQITNRTHNHFKIFSSILCNRMDCPFFTAEVDILKFLVRNVECSGRS